MNTAISRAVGTIGLFCISAVALAGETKPATPQEPLGFVTGGVIGAFAAGPIGAVVGATLIGGQTEQVVTLIDCRTIVQKRMG